MSSKRISELGPDELSALVKREIINELTALEVLRNPHCSAEIAERVADQKHILASHGVRQLLCSIQGFPIARAMNLLATLPWLPLLELVASPRTPPVVRRQAERKLLLKLPNLALGEKVAMARRSPRPFFRALIATGDDMILSALLNNGRLVENDVLIMLNTAKVSPEFCRELASHQRWGQYHAIRKAMAACSKTPFAVALSMLVLLNETDLRELVSRPDVGDELKNAIRVLLDRRKMRKITDSDVVDMPFRRRK